MKFFKSKSGWTDQELLTQFKTQQDLEALAVLYGRYMHLVYGVCLKYFKNEAESQDAVMQIFEELVQKLAQHQVLNFKSWLHVLSKNYCLMQLRKQQKHEHVNLEEQNMEMEADVHPTSWSLKESKLQLMEQCMEQLNAEQRQCVSLFYLEHKCYKEIESITGLEPMKVKSHIQNGKRNIRICMEKQQDHDE